MEQFEETYWFAMILGVGAIQGFFVAFSLQKIKKGNRKANQKLSLLVFLLSIGLLGRFAYNSHVWETIPQLFLLEDIAMFLYGPIFYMYLKDLLFRHSFYFKSLWLHFVPTVVHFVAIFFQWTISPDVYLKMVAEFYPPLFNAWYLTEIMALLSLTAYLLACVRLIMRYNRQEKEFLSFDSKSSYLAILVGIIFIGVGMWWHNYFRFLAGMPKLSIWLGFDAAWCTITILNFILGYFAITRQELFVLTKIGNSGPTAQVPKIENEKREHIKETLFSAMQTEKLFLNSALSLFDIASKVEEPPHVVSKIINSEFNKNFFDFVNSYRIEEFIVMAKAEEYRKLTLLAIAFDAGFNSKTAFNKAFKKEKGMTPREYLKNHTTFSGAVSAVA